MTAVSVHPMPIMIGLCMRVHGWNVESHFEGVAEILRKIFTFALARPARETLFTSLSPDEKYKAKILIDTIFQRLGDVFGASIFQILHTTISHPSSIAFASIWLSTTWTIISWKLGLRHQSM